MKCPICRRNTERLICESCWSYAIEQLKDFPDKYNQLEDELLPSRGYGQRVSGTKTPPLPVRLETLYLRTGGMSRILMVHETIIRREQHHTMITFRGEEIHRVTKTVEYLSTHEEWIYKNYTDADNLTKHILDIANRVKYVLGFKSDEMVIGNCPTVDNEGNACSAPLRVNVKIIETGGNITCRACKTTWTEEHWRLLGRVIESEELVEASSSKRQPRSKWTV